MKRYVIQLKNILKDKMSLLSFLLPIILAILVNIFLSTDLEFITNISFAFFTEVGEETEWKNVLEKLEQYGDVVLCNSEKELLDIIRNVKDETIGIKMKDEGQITSVLAGDETTYSKSLAQKLPQMIQYPYTHDYIKQDAANVVVRFKNVFIALVMIIAVFIGCTFTAMHVIAEKEDGINNIYDVMPQNPGQRVMSKILMGFIISMVISILSLAICIGINKNIIFLLPLIILGTYISSVMGLLIGIYSENSMIGIVYIKIIMIFFIAVPLLFYLYFVTDNTYSKLLNIVPSYTFFMTLIAGLEGVVSELSNYLSMALSCIILTVWCFIKFGLIKSRKDCLIKNPRLSNK